MGDPDLDAREASIRAAHAGYAETFAALYRLWVEGGAKGTDLHDLMDPVNECEHGRLPLDRTQTCRCWGVAPALMTGPAYIPKEKPVPTPARKRHLTAVPAPAPTLLERIVAELDAEIARLMRARDALTESTKEAA